MRITFLKVFLVILLSNLLVTSIGYSIIHFAQSRWEIKPERLGEAGVELVDLYESSGVRALREKARKFERELRGHLFLFEESGMSLLQPLPKDFYFERGQSDEQRSKSNLPKSQFIQINSGNNHRYMLVFRPDPRMRPNSDFQQIPFFLLGLFVASGVVAYWLLGPLSKLQRVARQFGRGNMEVRVDRNLAKRSDAIGKLALEFNEMADRIETLLTSKERLMRDVSHELRTPLARIEVALTLAEDKQGQEAQQRYLDRIRDELHELDDLIGQVLMLSRLEAAALKKESIQVNEWLGDIIEDVAFESQLKGIQIVRLGSQPDVLLGDPLQLRHAIENVLRNACFYAESGGVVEVETTKQGSQAVICIRDHGPGVEEEKLEKIFQAFYRSSDAREANSGGFGVGLTISQRIIQAHKGSIEARNRKEGGLEVCFRLPLNN